MLRGTSTVQEWLRKVSEAFCSGSALLNPLVQMQYFGSIPRVVGADLWGFGLGFSSSSEAASQSFLSVVPGSGVQRFGFRETLNPIGFRETLNPMRLPCLSKLSAVRAPEKAEQSPRFCIC